MTLPRETEQQLVARARTQPAAFGELYEQHVGDVYRFVFSRVRVQAAAEDITAEVFLKALRAIPRYRPQGRPFAAWLRQISANAIVDHHRATRPTWALDDAIPVVDPEMPVEERVVRRDQMARVWAAVGMLPAQQRTALTLKFADDLKLAQIGTLMGKSEGSIKLLVHRGMLSLRQRLASDWAAR